MKLVIKILGWVARVIIYLYWVIFLCIWAVPYNVHEGNVLEAVLTLSVVLAVFSGVLFILLRILKNRKRDLRLIVWSVLGITLVLFSVDSPAPELKYTIADLVQPKEMTASYETLMRYQKGGERKFEFALPSNLGDLSNTWTNLLPHTEAIESAWKNCADGRSYIHDLDQFPSIADYIDFAGPPVETPIPSFQTWRTIARTYWLYSMLKVQQGNIDEGIQVISQLNSVIHKSLPNSTTLVSKMINIAIAKGNIRTVNYMLSKATFTPDQLLAIKEAFPPFRGEQVSLRRPIISEYSVVQYYAPELKLDPTDLFDSLSSSPSLKACLKVVMPFIYKPNQTLVDLKDLYEPLLEDIASNRNSHPQDIGSKKLDGYVATLRKRPNNLMGTWLIAIATPSFNKAFQNATKTKAYSDILALEIHKKLGEELELKDTYTEKNYLFDKTRQCFFSVGSDGLPDTKDDVYIIK